MTTTDARSAVIYRDIPGFPGYRVGDDGSVWSAWARKRRPTGYGTYMLIGSNWKRLAPSSDERGRQFVGLSRDRKSLKCSVPRLVLSAFVGPCPVGMEACHDPDNSPSNNALSNLRWDTKSANEADKLKHGTDCRGERNGSAILTAEDVLRIRSEYAAGGISYASLGRKYGVSKTAIRLAVTGKRWGASLTAAASG